MSNIKCIKTTDKERCCDTCKYSSTNGFFAPSYWCNKYQKHGDRGGLMYNSYINNTGTVCDDWEEKNNV